MLRLGLVHYNTADEVDRVVEALSMLEPCAESGGVV